MNVSESGSKIVSSDSHKAKAFSPTLAVDGGIAICLRESHLSNALLPICFVDSGRIIFFNLLHP